MYVVEVCELLIDDDEVHEAVVEKLKGPDWIPDLLLCNDERKVNRLTGGGGP